MQMTLLGKEAEETTEYTDERKKIIKEHLDKVEEHNERVRQSNFENLDNKNKKVVMTIEYGLDNEDKRDFFISDNRENSCMGGIGSSGCEVAKNGFEQAEIEGIEWLMESILDDGYLRENVKIVRKEMTKEGIKEHYEQRKRDTQKKIDDTQKEIVLINKQLEKTKKELEELQKKLGDIDGIKNTRIQGVN